jgi:hypothetical protein
VPGRSATYDDAITCDDAIIYNDAITYDDAIRKQIGEGMRLLRGSVAGVN